MITLNQQFRVALPVDEAWELMTDLPKVARCMPGARLDHVSDGEYRGGLSTRIGPISASYRGSAVFRERDDVAHRAVIEARGREEKGSGSASAVITTALTPEGGGTLVDVATELAISGRAAQFGRSLLEEVSSSLLAQFVRELEAMARADHSSEVPGPGPSPAAEGPSADQQSPSLDLLASVGLPLLRRAAPPVLAALAAGAVGLLIGRRGRRARSDHDVAFVVCVPPPPIGRDRPGAS